MTNLLMRLSGLMVRLGLLLAGLMFFASLLAAALLVLLVWLLRALWANVTGQPVSRWRFQLNRQAMWQRFYTGPRQRYGGTDTTTDNVVDVQTTDVSTVTDVQPKRITPP